MLCILMNAVAIGALSGLAMANTYWWTAFIAWAVAWGTFFYVQVLTRKWTIDKVQEILREAETRGQSRIIQ